jgi:hypothetical protein
MDTVFDRLIDIRSMSINDGNSIEERGLYISASEEPTRDKKRKLGKCEQKEKIRDNAN